MKSEAIPRCFLSTHNKHTDSFLFTNRKHPETQTYTDTHRQTQINTEIVIDTQPSRYATHRNMGTQILEKFKLHSNILYWKHILCVEVLISDIYWPSILSAFHPS